MTVATACCHHWLIESPNGPTSRGRCQLCGEERDFKNDIDAPDSAATRICPGCGRTLPVTSFFFAPKDRMNVRLQSRCRSCLSRQRHERKVRSRQATNTRPSTVSGQIEGFIIVPAWMLSPAGRAKMRGETDVAAERGQRRLVEKRQEDDMNEIQETTDQEVALGGTPPRAIAAIFVRSNLQRFHERLYQEAKEVAEKRQAEVEELREGLCAAEATDQHEQARRYRNRITRRSRDVNRAERVLEALQAGYVPMPRLPAVSLAYALGLIPPDALLALDEAKKTGLFEEFRVVDGRNAHKDGYPQSWTPPKGRDPILVAMIGDELFPLAWWR